MIPGQRFFQKLDTNFDGTGTTEFATDLSGAGFAIPGIRDANRVFYVHQFLLYIQDSGVGGWQSSKFSSSVSGVSRWVQFSIANYNTGVISINPHADTKPKRQREYIAGAGTVRNFHEFSGTATDASLIFRYGTPDGIPYKVTPGVHRLQAFLNNDFTTLDHLQVSAEISYE